MNHLTIKVRIWLLGILAIAGVAFSGGFGALQLSNLYSKLESGHADINVGVNALVDIQQGNVAFKTQIQEWKNILIRGNNEELFVKYEKAFYEKEKLAQEQLKSALDGLKKENDPANQTFIAELEKIIKAHVELGGVYQGLFTRTAWLIQVCH